MIFYTAMLNMIKNLLKVQMFYIATDQILVYPLLVFSVVI